jgi:hypothetical protein
MRVKELTDYGSTPGTWTTADMYDNMYQYECDIKLTSYQGDVILLASRGNETMNKALKQASDKVGGLSNPSKMPCFSYSLPATACKVGSKLRNIKGSICEGCYACKGNYNYPCVKNALDRRLQSLTDLYQWTANMIKAIELTGNKWFRWHDSGDLQGLEHLEAIAAIAKALPNVSFWLPTKEYKVVKEYIAKHAQFPINLIVRVSAAMVDQVAPKIAGLPTSVVMSTNVHDCPGNVHYCPAPQQGGKCQDCRMCWDVNCLTVAYAKH